MKYTTQMILDAGKQAGIGWIEVEKLVKFLPDLPETSGTDKPALSRLQEILLSLGDDVYEDCVNITFYKVASVNIGEIRSKSGDLLFPEMQALAHTIEDAAKVVLDRYNRWEKEEAHDKKKMQEELRILQAKVDWLEDRLKEISSL